MALLERDAELTAVDALLSAGGVLLVEGSAGIGKTALLDVASRQAAGRGREVLRAAGAELETGFALGVVHQLLDRRLARAAAPERELVLQGPARQAWALLRAPGPMGREDTTFAVMDGLCWLVANLAAARPLLLTVDDAHWADQPSLLWLVYLARRMDVPAVSLLVATRPAPSGADPPALLALRQRADRVLRPRPLSGDAVSAMAREELGARADAGLCSQLARSSGGNPFYVRELLRAVGSTTAAGAPWEQTESAAVMEVLPQVDARLRRLGPAARRLAQAVAVLGHGCPVGQAAALAGQPPDEALRAAAALQRDDVLASIDPARFVHPIVRSALLATLDESERAQLHRAAAGLLHAEGAPAGRVAAHLRGLPRIGDRWVCDRLREAAAEAMCAGAPHDAGELLRRARAEPPPAADQVTVLRELARADVTAGRGSARNWLDEALSRTADPRERARIAAEVAEASAALFRWADAVDTVERALDELGDADPALTAELQARLVVAGLHDARRAARVGPALDRLGAAGAEVASGEAVAVARGMAALLAGRPAAEVTAPLAAVLSAGARVDDWDTRAALLWCLVTADGFVAVENSLPALHAELRRTGSARGLVAVHSAVGFMRLRQGALPEADAAARIALRVLQEGDFAPGLPFAITVLADVAVEAGEFADAGQLLALLPPDQPPGVGTVLVPAAWGRLHLAAGRFHEAVAAFRACAALFSADVWGREIRDVGYLHARSGAALALHRLGDHERARRLADAELADVRVFGAPRALGVALRVAGLVHGGTAGLRLLEESASVLTGSPARLERARTLAELGSAQRRAGRPRPARDNLAEALDLAARCGARALVQHAREELRAAGGRPRRAWRRGVESLTPAELRVVRMAAEGRTNRQIAQDLYVTVKTVEGHLAHAYAKLGIPGRPQLPGTLAAQTTRVAAR